MKFLREILAPLYLGGSLSLFANVHWYQWQLYAIVVPFFILVKITGFNREENN